MKRKKSGKADALYTTHALPAHTSTVLPNDEIWLSTAEIIHYFKVSERTVLRWRKNGILPSTKLGGTVLHPYHLVNKLLHHRIRQQLIEQNP